MRILLLLPVVLLLFPAALCAQPGAFDKAKLAWNLPWDADWVTAVSFVGPKRVAAGNNLGEILIWELPAESGGTAPKPVRRLVGHTNTVTRLLSTPDGRWLISASNDRSIRFWDMQMEAKGAATVVLNARTREDAIKRKSPKVPPPIEVSLAVQEAARVLTGHKDWVLGLGLSADGNTLVSGDDKGDVIVWDRPTGKELRRWKVKGWVWALAVAPDASSVCISERVHLVFDSGRHQGLKLWDVQHGELKHDLTKTMAKEMPIAAAAYSPDGKLLAVGRGGEVGGNDGKVTLLDAADGKKLRDLTPGHLNGLTDIVFSPDGKHVLSSGRDTVVRAWNVADGKLVKEFGTPRGGQFKDWIHAIAVSPDARWLAAADMAGQVQMWSLMGK